LAADDARQRSRRRLHKGKATTGEVVSVSDGKLEMKTSAGPLTVTLNDKTKYEHGSKAATKSHLERDSM